MMRRSFTCRSPNQKTLQRVVGIAQKHHEHTKKLESEWRQQLNQHFQNIYVDLKAFVQDEITSAYELEKDVRTRVVSSIPTVQVDRERDDEVYVEMEDDYHNSDEYVREDFVPEDQ